jgi:hypothetical protein
MNAPMPAHASDGGKGGNAGRGTMADEMIPMLLLASSPAIGLAAGRWLGKRWRPSARALTRCAAAALAIFIVAWLLALAFPGPASRYAPDGITAWLRDGVLAPASLMALGVPAAIALLGGAVRPEGMQRNLMVLALAYTSGVIMLPLSLVLGCHHAGACL